MVKKLLTATIFASLFLVYAPSVFAQDDNTKTDNSDQETELDTAMKTPMMCQHVAIGVEAGVNISNYIYGHPTGDQLVTATPLVRGRAGAIVDIPVHGIFSIQPGVFYVMNGASITSGNTWNVNTLEVPVNFMFKFPMQGHFCLFVGAGPYFGYNFGGYTSPNNDGFKIGTNRSDNLEPIDAGVGVNGGIELACNWFFRLRFQQGLANLEPSGSTAYQYVNSVSYGVQVGYMFGGKCKCARSKRQPQTEERVWDQ